MYHQTSSHVPVISGSSKWASGRFGTVPFPDLLDYLQDRAGSALRVVSRYTPSGYEIHFLRDDLDPEAVEDRIESLSGRVTPTDTPQDEPLTELGEELAMVQLRDEAVIVRFPLDEPGRLFVSMDVEVARNLHGFTVECAELLASTDQLFPENE